MHTTRHGYMSVNEAAVFYGVSRAKLHRLIRFGRLTTEKDPRDHRVTLLISNELEAIFQFPANNILDTKKLPSDLADSENISGILTPTLRAEIDSLRKRLLDRVKQSVGNVIVGREAENARGLHLYETVFGEDSNDEYQK